ncbi:hypothetical protein GS399_17895 [Pedobacter sp. HMF7647]|uniref:Uncharacterized protein n=1 Tax=Hufsiella arboris TaxID=2695275 RepID=A0A7K1YFT8_9SPHI|nr:hypothetical protein [Hufsiella arboris]MXV52849.1 hypothetical protein [Hufsiella arboris]
MKKILSLLVVCVMIAAACKKDSGKLENKPDGTATGQKFPVSFKVSEFSSNVSPFPAQGNHKGQKVSGLSDQIKYLYYYVAKESDSLTMLKSIKQVYSTNPDSPDNYDFGFLQDTLPAGKYQIYIIGSNRPDADVYFIKEEQIYTPPGVYLDFTNWDETNDIGDNFYKKLHLTVTQASPNEVKLDRLVGKVNVKALDAIPQGISKVKVCFGTGSFLFDLGSGNGIYHSGSIPFRTIEYLIKPEDIGKKDLTLSTYFWEAGVSVNLYIYNAAGEEIDHKFVSNGVSLKKNTMVTFSGKFFSLGQGFRVTLNDQWGPETNQGFEYP